MKSIVIVSPLPPTKSGIADYVYEQLPYLSKYYKITLVVGDNQQANVLPPEYSVFKYSEFIDLLPEYTDQSFIYHIGNNIHHEHCIELFKRKKGIIVLHDYCLHHIVTELTLARGDFEGYKNILSQSHGELGEQIAEKRKRGIYNDLIPFIFPANKFLLREAKGIIVHSDWAHTKVKINTNDKVPTVKIPMHYKGANDELSNLSRDSIRTDLGIDKQKLVFTSVGFITPPKQIQMVLKTLAAIKDKLPDFEYIMVGEPYDKKWLEKLISEHGLNDCARYTGYISLEEMQSYIHASDFSICLRYPSAGETSATLMRCLGSGIPSIIFNYSSYSDFPNDVVLKIKLDTHNLDHLGDAILQLASEEHLQDKYKEKILHYVNTEHNIKNVVEKYQNFIDICNS